MLQSIFDQIGLTASLEINEESWNTASEVFKRVYPSFEETTGWSADGSKEEMPAAIRDKLRAYYKRPNELLFELLGRRFDWQL